MQQRLKSAMIDPAYCHMESNAHRPARIILNIQDGGRNGLGANENSVFLIAYVIKLHNLDHPPPNKKFGEITQWIWLESSDAFSISNQSNLWWASYKKHMIKEQLSNNVMISNVMH